MFNRNSFSSMNEKSMILLHTRVREENSSDFSLKHLYLIELSSFSLSCSPDKMVVNDWRNPQRRTGEAAKNAWATIEISIIAETS